MTPYRSFVTTNPLFRVNERRWPAVLAGVLFTSTAPALILGCGARTDDPPGSTDTGNPPVIAETKLHVIASEGGGVVVAGSPGAVSAGAEITVTNVTTKQSQQTQAASDGSFEVPIGGSISDEYRVEAELNGKHARVDVEAPAVNVELDGHDFVLDGVQGYELVEGTSVTLSFDEGRLLLHPGCNSISGSFSECGGELCVGELTSTAIGCSAEVLAQDDWFGEFFTSMPKLDYTAPRLTLTHAGATLEFLDREVANPDRRLTDRTWTFDTMIQGGAASNLPLSQPATIQFNRDGSFGAFDACNALTGTYVADASTLTFSDVASDEAFCDTDTNFQDFFGQFLDAGTCTYDIEANRLTLMQQTSGLSATTE